ncbi:DJ-1/PfpI family protein [Pseudomonas knackmussii]|uniref:DJ-1/PfpI family protein n=1 Tax=Pseudomonas knackmussii TaxID=65741 RepID=UPI003F4A65D5
MRILLLTALLLFQAIVARAEDERMPSFHPRVEGGRPLVAVVGENRMTELVDFLVPYGVLNRAGVAEVMALSTDEGPLNLMPALRVRAQMTTAEFARRYPQGADYLIVPAVHDSGDSGLVQFVATQAAKGAVIVGICDGAKVLAQAGLLDGRQATAHWYSRRQREHDFPAVRWQNGRRYVVDGRLVTSSGVSAALPVSLALVEAIGGSARAEALGSELGIDDWSPRLDGQASSLGFDGYLAAATNTLAFWRHETFGVPLQAGIDEIALALRIDAWARSYRTDVLTTGAAPVISRAGLELLPDTAATDLSPLPGRALPAGETLDEALDLLTTRYNQETAKLVAAQLEYPRPERRAATDSRKTMDYP